ncbi:hypothetical protein PpBr36_07160, partial [Pyricularia pennisetigena]|uniref:hypothetical protein n=1 Tax=Pyricularia pennisetigena TaxID=1578925 RepID=UPI00115171FD
QVLYSTSPLDTTPRNFWGPHAVPKGPEGGQGWGAYPCLSVTVSTGKTPFKHTESRTSLTTYRIVDR